jgi:hypothetical protein
MVFFLIICIPLAVCFPHCLVEIPLEPMLDIKIVQDLEFSSTKQSCTSLNDDDAQSMDREILTDTSNDSREISSPIAERDESIVISNTNREYDMEDGGFTAIQQQQQHKSTGHPISIGVPNLSCHDKNDDDIESRQHSIILLDMKSNPSCDICLMSYKVGDEVTISHNPDCSHIFHKGMYTRMAK